MNTIVLLYDCPLETCDKIWLYNGLKKYGDVKVVGTMTKKSYFRISRFAPKLRIGKLIRTLLVFVQCIRGILISDRDDVVIVWARDQGYIFQRLSMFFMAKRKIVSFNWLGVPAKQKAGIKRILSDGNFMAIINDKTLKGNFIDSYKLKKWNGFFLPDAYDDSRTFNNVAKKNKKYDKKYVFAGGVNNRDWDTLVEAARRTPEIEYVIVSNKGEVKKQDLNNLTVKENLSAEEYYTFMERAFLVICPLKEDRVSGLINILKAAQFGIPCISTKLGVTEMYYSASGKKNLLYEKNNHKDLVKKIKGVYGLNSEEYIKTAVEYQTYIRKNFDPEKNIEKLVTELKNRGWIR